MALITAFQPTLVSTHFLQLVYHLQTAIHMVRMPLSHVQPSAWEASVALETKMTAGIVYNAFLLPEGLLMSWCALHLSETSLLTTGTRQNCAAVFFVVAQHAC